jgi:glycogen(starch) synthase
VKIVISSKRFLPTLGGTVRYTEMLARGFQDLGHEVRILTRTPAAGSDQTDAEILIRCPDMQKAMELAEWADVLLQVDASWKDAWPFIFKRRPWFTTIHFGRPLGKTSLKQKVALAGLAVAFRLSRTIPISHQVAKDWNLMEEPIANPFDDSIFHPPTQGSRDIDLLFVGRLERSKGIFVLLEALRQVKANLPEEMRCVVVGEGKDQEEFERLAGSTGLSFIHAGRLDPSEVADWMRRSRLLVFPTTPEWIEASPLTPLEAVACGCQVIASDNGGTRENIGSCGVLVTSGSVGSLAMALRKHYPRTVDSHAMSDQDLAFLASRKLMPTCKLYLDRLAAHGHS